MSAGMFGLMDSLRKQIESPQDGFEGYARMRIRGAIFDELRAQDWLSRRARDAAKKKQASTAFVSLNELTIVEEQSLIGSHPDPTEVLETRSEMRALGTAVTQLPVRERHIIVSYYFEGASFKDIGRALGISEPRVSQLHARALEKLRWLVQSAA